MYEPPFTLIIGKMWPGSKGEPPWESVERRLFHTEADSLDDADVVLNDEDERRAKDARRLPCLSALRLEGPNGLFLEGEALRRAARAPRD